MSTEDGTPSEPTTTEQRLALNRELFGERNRLIDSERNLATRYQNQPTPQLAKEGEHTRRSLERVTGKIVEANKGLVVNRVSHYIKKATSDQREEYMAAGLAGLVEAIDTYDVTVDNFAAWAYWPVKGAVLDAVHATEHQTLSDCDFEKRPAVLAAFTQLEQDSGGTAPSYEEVADCAGATVAQVKRILLATSMRGIDETWGKELSAKHIVSEFDDPPVDPALSDNSWEENQKELLKDRDIDIQDLLMFIDRNLVPEQFGGALSYQATGRRFGVSGETARKAELRVRKIIISKGWKVPEDLEDPED